MGEDKAATKPAEEAEADRKTSGGHEPAKAGEHLERRQKRNTALTEEAMRNPTGGAHSGAPDHNNP